MAQQKHVFEFSPDGKYLALINVDGRLLIWDTETSQLKQSFTLSTKTHANCTALVWIPSSTQSPKKKEARRSSDNQNQLFIALGTSKGKVDLYSFGTGQLLDDQQSFKGAGHTGQIFGIFFDKLDTLYTCGADSQIISWSFKKMCQTSSMKVGTDIPHSIVVIPKSKTIVSGGRRLSLWNFTNGELIRTFTGHTSNITIVRHIHHAGVDYIMTGSSADRILSLWCLDGIEKNKNSMATFLMEDLAINVSNLTTDEGLLKVVAVTRTGVVHYFVDKIKTMRSDKPIKPKVTVEIVADSTQVVEGIPSFVASIEYQKNPDEILIGYGAKQFLHFENIKPVLGTKNHIEMRADPRKITKSSDDQANRDLNTVVPIIDHKKVEYLSNEASAPRKTDKIMELPMETRLENLSISTLDGMPQKNMAQLLIQGLHSKDAAILRLVFACHDEKTIECTIQKLPPMYIKSLIMELSSLMRRKTIFVQTATKWMKCLLSSHSSQLMAIGPKELCHEFGECIGIIETRAENLKTLSRLRGRLELLCTQMKQTENNQSEGLNESNLLVYQDKDSSDEGMADDQESGSSDGNHWEEENSDDDEQEIQKTDDSNDESEMEVSD